jgi:hypothetical protein
VGYDEIHHQSISQLLELVTLWAICRLLSDLFCHSCNANVPDTVRSVWPSLKPYTSSLMSHTSFSRRRLIQNPEKVIVVVVVNGAVVPPDRHSRPQILLFIHHSSQHHNMWKSLVYSSSELLVSVKEIRSIISINDCRVFKQKCWTSWIWLVFGDDVIPFFCYCGRNLFCQNLFFNRQHRQ